MTDYGRDTNIGSSKMADGKHIVTLLEAILGEDAPDIMSEIVGESEDSDLED